MSEKRLIEITSEICKTGDPLWTMAYITTLNASEVYLLLRYVASSTYRGMNLYDALFRFSCDYLKSKNIIVKIQNVEFNNEVSNASSYVNNIYENDKFMKVVGGSPKR